MFTNFTRGAYGKEIAVQLSESHIIMFIAHMEERGYARATIRTFISALSYPHRMRSLADPARGWVVKKMLDTVGQGQGRRNRLPIGEKLLRMVKMANRQWNSEKVRLMTAIFMILYHGCLRIGKAVFSEGNLENVLKRMQVEVVRVGRSGHDAVLRMHTFKHNKSQKQVSIQVKGSVKGCPGCSIVEYLAWRDSEKMGASQPVFVWNNVRPVTARQVAKVVNDVLELLGEESTGYSTHSFRIGRATEEAVKGASDAQLRDLGRWKSLAF